MCASGVSDRHRHDYFSTCYFFTIFKKLPGVFFEEKPFELVMALTAPTSVITLLVESN